MEMVVSFPGGKKVDAQYRGFTIQTDQSIDNGGESSAPAPFDFFLASIGTCAGIYVLQFCQHRNIPTEKIRLIQRMERNGDTRMVEKIVIEIRVPSDFPQNYRAAMARSAELCAVKKHMEQPPRFSVVTSVASE